MIKNLNRIYGAFPCNFKLIVNEFFELKCIFEWLT